MQTDYSVDMAVGQVGMLADNSGKLVDTHINAAGEVKVGCVVTKGASDGLIVHPDAAAEVTDEKLVRGVVMASHEMECQPGSAAPGYVVKSVVPVLRKGRIWIKAENAITEGTSTVNVRVAGSGGTGGTTQLGAIRGDADSSNTAVLPKSRWKSSSTGNGELAVLEVDL